VRPTRLLGALAVSVLAASLLAGCTETPSYDGQGSTGYVSGDGAYKEIPPKDRKPAVTFTSKLDTGAKITSADLLGKVHVLNFWYAGCGPCNAEAPLLQKVYAGYKGSIPFVGVNTYDQAPTALAFEEHYKVTYPSVIDTNTVAVQYAYSAWVPPDAVPTTLVIDRHGRVAARVTGEIDDASILTSLVKTVVSEGQ